ncbi:MAG TPA: CbtB-domain containing protein [Rhodospirillales bacterium]
MTRATFARMTVLDNALLAKLPAAMLAAFLGFFILYGVGFAPVAAVHTAAHDGRHAFAFPCH